MAKRLKENADTSQPQCSQCAFAKLKDDTLLQISRQSGRVCILRDVNKYLHAFVNKHFTFKLKLTSNADYMQRLQLRQKDNIVAISANALISIDDNMRNFTEAILQFKNLQLLEFQENPITPDNMLHLVEILKSLTNFKSLDLSDNGIREGMDKLATELGKLTNLQTLNLSKNRIGSGVDNLGQLTNLQTLNLSDNPIGENMVELAPELGKLTNLKSLDLSRNYIGEYMNEFAPALEKLTNLHTLTLAHIAINDVSCFPQIISKTIHPVVTDRSLDSHRYIRNSWHQYSGNSANYRSWTCLAIL